MNDYLDADIRVLISPDHPTRLALLLTYRQGLQTSPAAAWNMALDLARERFPRISDYQLRCMLLLTLGLFGAPNDFTRMKTGQPPDLSDHVPVLIKGRVAFRLPGTARHFGLTADDLASRVLGAWIEAACDFDGNPLDPSAHDYLRGDGKHGVAD